MGRRAAPPVAWHPWLNWKETQTRAKGKKGAAASGRTGKKQEGFPRNARTHAGHTASWREASRGGRAINGVSFSWREASRRAHMPGIPRAGEKRRVEAEQLMVVFFPWREASRGHNACTVRFGLPAKFACNRE